MRLKNLKALENRLEVYFILINTWVLDSLSRLDPDLHRIYHHLIFFKSNDNSYFKLDAIKFFSAVLSELAINHQSVDDAPSFQGIIGFLSKEIYELKKYKVSMAEDGQPLLAGHEYDAFKLEKTQLSLVRKLPKQTEDEIKNTFKDIFIIAQKLSFIQGLIEYRIKVNKESDSHNKFSEQETQEKRHIKKQLNKLEFVPKKIKSKEIEETINEIDQSLFKLFPAFIQIRSSLILTLITSGSQYIIAYSSLDSAYKSVKNNFKNSNYNKASHELVNAINERPNKKDKFIEFIFSDEVHELATQIHETSIQIQSALTPESLLKYNLKLLNDICLFILKTVDLSLKTCHQKDKVHKNTTFEGFFGISLDDLNLNLNDQIETKINESKRKNENSSENAIGDLYIKFNAAIDNNIDVKEVFNKLREKIIYGLACLTILSHIDAELLTEEHLKISDEIIQHVFVINLPIMFLKTYEAIIREYCEPQLNALQEKELLLANTIAFQAASIDDSIKKCDALKKSKNISKKDKEANVQLKQSLEQAQLKDVENLNQIKAQRTALLTQIILPEIIETHWKDIVVDQKSQSKADFIESCQSWFESINTAFASSWGEAHYTGQSKAIAGQEHISKFSIYDPAKNSKGLEDVPGYR